MRAQVSLRPARVLLLLLLLATLSAEAFRLPPGYGDKNLFDRANDACPTNANLTQCGQGLPSTFCCDLSATRCVVIANGTGALCCPNQSDGSPGDCQTMSPINGGCDADNYNATLFPTSPIHLKVIPSSFTPCGSEDGVCCPPGFQCSSGKCVTQDKGIASVTGSAAATASAVTLSSAHPTLQSTSNAQAQSAPSDSNSSSGPSTSQFPPIAILVGLFSGIVVGALLTFAVVTCLNRHRKHKRRHRRHRHHSHRKMTGDNDDVSDLGPIRAQVSDPIYHDDGTGRVDFLRRNTNSRHRSQDDNNVSPLSRSPALSRVRSLFSRRSTTHQSPRGLGVGGLDDDAHPHTPHRTPKREPSMESITIFSPPDMRHNAGAGEAGDRTTTYSDVLRAAGANPHAHEPLPMPIPMPMPTAYAGSPGLVDPRSRGVDNGNLR